MREREARRRFERARVATLGTVSAAGEPHLVPVVFAVDGDAVVTAVDGKPKSTRRLRRLDHVRATGRVSLLVDEYDEDWTRLWWVRMDGAADVVDATSPSGERGIWALVQKYPQYTDALPAGPVIVVRPRRWVGWVSRAHAEPRPG
ncbi:TIGR03668 family PPOX class F420-dependent oxidoreductase [Rhodococcus sp. NPDC058505]|uniref:TIGR03668 family PPOX class F420-dependent oxidoreductase n=1 Tax=unclassified Rhodococcus (in: high G+C Gram-positive bacteria) TaxID=192944 RepID=UPI003668FAE8